MAITAQDIINQASTFLSLTAKSAPIAAMLPDGTGEGTTPIISGTQQLLLWITEGMERCARLCVPVQDTAVANVSLAGPGGIVGPYTTIQSTAGRTLYVPTVVSIGNKALIPTNYGFLNSSIWFPPTPEGNPTGWVNSTTYIDLSYYTSSPEFNIAGYFLPIPVTTTATPIDPYFDDFARRTVAFYVAMMVASKNRDNSVLQTREAPCMNEFVGGVKEMYARLLQTDQTTAAIFPASPIDAMVQVAKQVTPKS